jgi:hypothetical protein
MKEDIIDRSEERYNHNHNLVFEEIFRQPLEKRYGYLHKVPAWDGYGSNLCIYALVGGVSTKVMTIQDRKQNAMDERQTIDVIIYKPFRRNLGVLLSTRFDTQINVKIEGFLRNDSYYVVPVTDELISRLLPNISMETPQPTVLTRAPLLERRHRTLSDLEIPSSSRNLDVVSFAVCAEEEEEESKRKRQRVSASTPSSLTLRRV